MLRDEAAIGREAIDLARIPSFRLGALLVTPATRQLEREDRNLTLEPRVMQVLVALWQAQGAVVTRDDLIMRCWAGRIVGDNAIQRAISRLRDVAGTLGEGCFTLETVARVGYRLLLSEARGEAEAVADDVPPERRRRFAAGAVAMIAVVAILGALFVWTRLPTADVMTIAVAGAQGRESSLAAGLAVDLSHFASARGLAMIFARGAEGIRPDYHLDIAEQRSGDRAQADAALFRSNSPELIWSYSVRMPGGNESLLRERLARTMARTIACALRIDGKSRRNGSGMLRLAFSACEHLDPDTDDRALDLWQRVVAGDPDNAPAMAMLAFVEAQRAISEFATDSLRQGEISGLRASAKRNLERARALDGRLGQTYAAEALLIPSSHYEEQIAVFNRGLARDPDCDVLYGLLSDALQNVGRMDEAIDAARKATELEPGSPIWPGKLALVLAYNGFTETARTELNTAERIWPDSSDLRDARFHFEFRFGDAAQLVRDIDTGNQMPNMPAFFQTGVSRAYFMARAYPTPENIAEAVRLSSRYYNAPQITVQNLVTLGRSDLAYEYLRNPAMVARLHGDGSNVLFRRDMRPFRADRRFMALADRLGLVAYWQSTHYWPDFCREKDLPYDCRAEARRLRSAAG